MYLKHLKLKGFKQFDTLELTFQPGITALVGRNDAGKSAIIDAIRLALQTRDQEFCKVHQEDFHIKSNGETATEISIICVLAELSDEEKAAFIEYLSYQDGEVTLHVNWFAKRIENPSSRRWLDISMRSGVNAVGPAFEGSVRQLLWATYLRPLRDAEREMSPGRGSRLSSILAAVPEICEGDPFDVNNIPPDSQAVSRLSLVGLAEYLCHQIKSHEGISSAQMTLNTQYLASLLLNGDNLEGRIDISQGGTTEARLRQILERLELSLLNSSGTSMGRYGLGSNNLLYMACELLLLGREPEGLPLLMIEEPEAHLHPQRQLRLMEFLNQASKTVIEGTRHPVQVLLTTHSPNLASKIPLENIILLQGQKAFSLAKNQTKLEEGDYRFLQRFLDVTKANLFFAHGVLIVEGDAEAILLPTIAKLIDRDLTAYGVSVVNVGSTGLSRYGRIFQRKDETAAMLEIPVACIADMDVMPNCAPQILGLVKGDDDDTWKSKQRRWKAQRDLDNQELNDRHNKLKANDGQMMKTFVADHWTLEYDLAFCGLAEQVHKAAILAKNDESLNKGKKQRNKVEALAERAFSFVQISAGQDKEVLCSHIYKLFHSKDASKAITAQYLAEILSAEFPSGALNASLLRSRLPKYIVDAIDYVTGQSAPNVAILPALSEASDE